MAEKIKALRVVAKREGFRRCGRRFGTQPVDVPLAELKPGRRGEAGEREILAADPMLVTSEVELEAPAEPAKK
jgi:hypothetical protein